MSTPETKSDPIGIRLTKQERQMLAEVTELLGFHSAADAVRYAIRHEHDALQAALAVTL